ncbi:MAG: PLP-dependent transferase [Sphaerotilus natans]
MCPPSASYQATFEGFARRGLDADAAAALMRRSVELESHPQHALAQRQMPLGGAVLTFRTARPQAMARQLAARLRLVHYAFSLGHQRSLVVLLDTAEMMESSYDLHGEALAEYRRWAGDGVFRLSVGLEHPDDLIADLDQALNTPLDTE